MGGAAATSGRHSRGRRRRIKLALRCREEATRMSPCATSGGA